MGRSKRNSESRMGKIILLLTLLFLFEHANSKIIIVSKNSGTSTIKSGIENANHGDTILIKKGIYKENQIIVNKSISIIGENDVEIDGENKFEILILKTDNIQIKNIHFKNAGISYLKDNAAIRIEGVSDCTIKNNKFTNNYFGIYLSKANNCKIIDNEIHSNGASESSSGNGVHQWYCKNNEVKNNNISGHRDGIYLEFSRNSFIENNKSENNIRYGLHFMYSDSCKYYSNIFSNNGSGVAVMYSNNIEMISNRFENNWGSASFGLLFKDIRNSYVAKNIIYKNTIGLHMEASSNLVIEKNIFKENGWGIKLMANSTDNIFTKNNFFSNSFDVSTNSRLNYNKFENNYWDNYKGYDLKKDGIGDTPYRPVNLFSLITASTPASLVLLKSHFIDILEISEKIIPVLTPAKLLDEKPSMKTIL